MREVWEIAEYCEKSKDKYFDCGPSAMHVVFAAPNWSARKPFYARKKHPKALRAALAAIGFDVQPPRPIETPPASPGATRSTVDVQGRAS